MNGSTPRNKIGNRRQALLADRPRRWRDWARAIAGSPGITRRRAPLQMALLRRARAATWIAQRNLFLHHSASNSSIVVKPLLRLSLHWTRTAASFTRSSLSATAADPAPAAPIAIRETAPVAPIDLIHRWTLREQRSQSQTVMREIVDRTRRLEERVRVEKRLVARGTPSPAAIAEQQDAARRSGPDWWKSDPPARGIRPPAAPAVNVDQIAETVMRRLDQRVSAWRERMGRM
jgi:hypothetical protein